MSWFDFLKSRRKKQPKLHDREMEVIQVSDEIQLTVKGLPPEVPQEKRSAVFESLVRNTLSRLPQRAYDRGENIYQGQARLRVEDKMYDIVFSLDAIRVLTALKIYKEAFDFVNEEAQNGNYDPELADLTSDYIKQLAWQEVQAIKNHNQPSTLIIQQVDEDIEVAIEGLPQSLITPAIRTEIVSKLVGETLQTGSTFPPELLERPKNTVFKIGGQSYKINYLFRVRSD